MSSFRFCRDCNNMLYPKEDKESHRLLFECRICNYAEEAGREHDKSRVYRHELRADLTETAGTIKDLGTDPTLPRSNKECPKCHNYECVFFQSQQRTADTSMVLFYVCLNEECNHVFKSDDKKND